MTPSTCKSVLGVFVSVGIRGEIPIVAENTIRMHSTHTAAVAEVARRAIVEFSWYKDIP